MQCRCLFLLVCICCGYFLAPAGANTSNGSSSSASRPWKRATLCNVRLDGNTKKRGPITLKSKADITDKTRKYTRTFEIKELSVPVSKADELKTFYRVIGNDERNKAVLKSGAN